MKKFFKSIFKSLFKEELESLEEKTKKLLELETCQKELLIANESLSKRLLSYSVQALKNIKVEERKPTLIKSEKILLKSSLVNHRLTYDKIVEIIKDSLFVDITNNLINFIETKTREEDDRFVISQELIIYPKTENTNAENN